MRVSWSERASWLSFVAACFTLSCGRSGDETVVPLELATGPAPPEVPEELGEPVPTSPVEAPRPDTADPRRGAVLAMLARECSGCHDAGAGGYLDLGALVDAGQLRPEQAETSPLVLWFQYGPSRVEHADVNVTAEEFDALVGYTNALDGFHDCPGYSLTDRDRALEHLLLDINSRAAEDRRFIRYVGAMPANQPGGCNSGLIENTAFLGIVNGVSLGPRPILPSDLVAHDSLSTPIFAVDMRDLGWTEPVELSGVGGGRFADRWEAIAAAASPYALELAGPEADALKRETGTSLPYVPAGAFVSVTSVGALYYALVGVGQNLNTLAAALGVEDEGSPQRAGVFGAGTWPDRVIRRRVQATAGHSWWTREELAWSGAGPRPLADDPVNYPDEGSEIIFTLPNGHFGFAIAGSDGSAVAELPSCIGGVPCPTPVRATNSITCRGCHADGFRGVSDEVLPFLDENPSQYPAELIPLIRDQYRPDLQLAQEGDTAPYGAAMAHVDDRLLQSYVGPAYHKFTARPLGASDVADELGVTIEQLRAGIDALGAAAPELAPLLAEGSIERAQLGARFQALACSIGGFRNMPASCP